MIVYAIGTLGLGDLPPGLDVEVTDGQSAATLALDLSSSSITVSIIGVSLVSGNAVGTRENLTAAVAGSNFRFEPTLGTNGGYIFNLTQSTEVDLPRPRLAALKSGAAAASR
jgi:hypothetical protein